MNVRTRLSLTLAAVVAITALPGALAGCGQKKQDTGPSCRQIVTYMMRIREMGTFDERGAIEECRRQKWTAKQRKCLYTAKSIDAMAACVPKIKVTNPGKGNLPMPEWHPPVEAPLETGPQRLEREAAEKAEREAAAAGSGKGAMAPAPAAPPPMPAPAPKSAPAPAKAM